MTDETPAKIRLKHRFEYLLVKTLKNRVLSASEKTLKIYQFAIYVLLYHVFRVNHKIVQTNLNIAFPDLSKEAQKKLLIANYQWSAQVTIALLRMDYWKGKTAEYVSFHNLAALDDALAEENGILLISAHLGHWEIIVPALAEKGYQMYIYVGEQSNPLVDDLQNKTRSSFGVETIGKGDSARFKFMRILRKRNILAMNVDQNDRKSDTFVKFFNKAAAVPKSAAGFHIARKSPILTAFGVFVGNKLEIHFERMLCEQTGDKEKDQLKITQEISNLIEKYVRKYPDQYFWMHRRWKTRPADDPEWVY
ncbi:MAG: lysophospholipid acyltransferase family protein [SAR324 cluster bacterium]|nr:lysophospholipid acyltransferase family protein [SAR324 cluster bacterium]